MSDYLDNLVRKGLNRAEMVQPRLASLFEPSPGAGGLMAGVSVGDLEMTEGEQLSGEMFEIPLTTQALFNSSAEAHPNVIGLNQSPSHPPGGIADQYTGQPPPSATVPQQPVAPVATQHESIAARSINTTAREKQDALERSVRQIENEQAALREALQSRQAGETEPVSTRGTRRITPAITVARERATSQSEPAAPTEQIAAREPAPTVKITIGRVDVRAVIPAAPATRPAPARPGPSLSLEDYLQQREGGKR